jgi:hypothetical protein
MVVIVATRSHSNNASRSNGIPTVINNYPPAHLLFCFLNLPFEFIFKLVDENFSLI